METTEMQAQRIVDEFIKMSNEQQQSYMVNGCEICQICSDYLAVIKTANELYNKNQRQENYIRLLEKENKELRGFDIGVIDEEENKYDENKLY